MTFRQIPKRYLIHTISIDGVEYSGVRMDNQNRLTAVNYGQVVESGHLLFVDAKNTPDYEQLKSKLVEGAMVIWNGKTLSVRVTEVLFTDKEHHMEVGLA